MDREVLFYEVLKDGSSFQLTGSHLNGPRWRLVLQPSHPHSRQLYGGENKEKEYNYLVRKVLRNCYTSPLFISDRPELSQVHSTLGYSLRSGRPVVTVDEGILGQLESMATVSPSITLNPRVATPSVCPSLTGTFLHQFVFFCVAIITQS